MTLHEAIEQLLIKEKRVMSFVEIADALNKYSWYSKKDGSAIKSNQISARVKNYPHLFNREGSMVTLKSRTGIRNHTSVKFNEKKQLNEASKNATLALKILMNEKNFKAADRVKGSFPSNPGLYCIRIKESFKIGSEFGPVLKQRGHNILYIGIASRSIEKRLGQELWAKGHGTFFRSLGAVLGFRPEPGSLVGKMNQSNYRFSIKDEESIVKWIHNNLLINWIEISDSLNMYEDQLIKTHLPLLNIAGNPGALIEVSVLRDKCKAIARTQN